jgi:hypothetical protein
VSAVALTEVDMLRRQPTKTRLTKVDVMPVSINKKIFTSENKPYHSVNVSYLNSREGGRPVFFFIRFLHGCSTFATMKRFWSHIG